MAKVSVIIAAYNIEKYISRCIESVINQTLKDIEIIVVNDGSTDNTLSIINKISNIDSRVIVVDQINRGLIEARKSGLKLAKGRYILFVDGDDWLEINCLEKLYNNAVDNNSDIVIYNSFISYDDKKIPQDTFIIKDNKNYLRELFLGKIMPAIWAKFIKLDYIKSNNIEFPRDISYAEDLASVISLFMHNPKVSLLNENLYNYYQRVDSITNHKNIKILEVDKAISFIKERLLKLSLYKDYKKEFEYMVYNHLFENCILKYTDMNEINNQLYKQYKNRNIKIKNNLYIMDKIKNYNISQRIRIRSYDKGYIYGKSYDRLREVVKGNNYEN